MTAASPVAVRIAAHVCSLRRVLTPDDVERVARVVERELARERERAESVEPAACSICERGRPTVAAPDLGLALCRECFPLFSRAMREGGAVRRSRCQSITRSAPPTCGRVFRVVYAEHRIDGLVDETHGACADCLEGQIAHAEKEAKG